MSSVNDNALDPSRNSAEGMVHESMVAIPMAQAKHDQHRSVGFLTEIRTGPPAVVAHRGASGAAPENTLAAARLALAIGADAVECDVRLTRDRVPVLFHDENLLRTAGVDAPIHSLTLAEIASLDAGSWKAPRYSAERIPTLRDALKLLGGEIPLVIELKSKGMEAEVVDVLRAVDTSNQDAILYARDFDSLANLRRLDTDTPVGLVIESASRHAEAWPDLLRSARDAGADGLAIDRRLATPERVSAAHGAGLWSHVWTVNSRQDLRAIADAGPSAITTDHPDLARRMLETDIDASFA